VGRRLRQISFEDRRPALVCGPLAILESPDRDSPALPRERTEESFALGDPVAFAGAVDFQVVRFAPKRSLLRQLAGERAEPPGRTPGIAENPARAPDCGVGRVSQYERFGGPVGMRQDDGVARIPIGPAVENEARTFECQRELDEPPAKRVGNRERREPDHLPPLGVRFPLAGDPELDSIADRERAPPLEPLGGPPPGQDELDVPARFRQAADGELRRSEAEERHQAEGDQHGSPQPV
jgi:hypothetical protein